MIVVGHIDVEWFPEDNDFRRAGRTPTMAKFTFLEVHLDGANVEANADSTTALPFSSIITGEDDEPDDEHPPAPEDEPSSDDADESPSPLAPLALLALLVVAVVVLKKVLGGDSEPAE